MTYYILRIAVFFIFANFSLVQVWGQTQVTKRSCGHNHIKESNKGGKSIHPDFDQKLIFQKDDGYQFRQLENPIILPVAIHFQEFVTMDTSCMISQAIDAVNRLNNDFHGTNPDIANWSQDQTSFPGINSGTSKIKFCLGKYNHPAGYNLNDGDKAITFNQTSGDRVLEWEGYLNIFVRNIPEFAGFSPAGGFGLGDGVTIDDNYFGTIECNGISIEVNYKLNRTVTHEVGHYLFLEHIWGPGDEDTSESINCTQDDNVADTPLAGLEHYGCPDVGSISCGTLDLTMNFMDYVNDPCMYMFTQGQVDRMEAYANLIMPSLTTNKFFACDGMSYCQNLPNSIDCVPTDGTFRIENVASEKSLMVVGGQTDDFAKIVQWDWTSCDYQQWTIEAQPNGYYKIFAKHSNKVIDAIFPDDNDDNNPDGIAFQFSDDTFLTQFWSIVPVPGKNCVFQIKSAMDDNYGLGIIYQSIYKGWNLQLQELNSNTNLSQQFRFYNLEQNLVTAQVSLNVKAYLQGPYDDSSGIMHDDLRAQSLLPMTNPYSNDSNFEHLAVESTDPSVLSISGKNAIIDWVLIEIRDENDPSIIVESRAALIQSDGDIIDIDGINPVSFESLAGFYYVALRHRNHLGIMTMNPVELGANTDINFTDPAFELYGANAVQISNNNHGVMWAGNANSNEDIIFQGTNNDTNNIFFDILNAPTNSRGATNYINSGYFKTDINLDGRVIYQGAQNDANIIFFNTLSHPNNNSGSTNFIISEQIP